MTHSGPVIGKRDNLKVILCRECGFSHLDPIPDNTSLYANSVFFHDLKPDYGAEYNEDRVWWHAVYSDWLSLVEDITVGRLLLDVGAGTGDFVNCALEHKWHAYGIEPDRDMANKHRLFCGGYRDFTPMHGYDVISAHWVLEHLQDPKDFLRWARDTLMDKGLLLVTIPNDFTHLQQRAIDAVGRPFYWLDLTHINYWSGVTFSEFLKRNGFEPRRFYGSWEPERHLIEGRNYLSDHTLGRKLHKERMDTEMSWGATHRRQRMKSAGLMYSGRDLTFVAVKR